MKKYSRREFIDHAAKGTAGLLVLPLAGRAITQRSGSSLSNSRVVTVSDDNSISGNQFNQAVIQQMVDSGIRSLTGIEDAGEAWKSLFPGLNQNSVIGIKINCIASGMPSHPEVTYSVCNALTSMQVNGASFPENNIIIWDRTTGELRNAGYSINTDSSGIRCFGTNQSGVGYSSTNYDVNGSSQKISTILTDMSDYLVNLYVLKNHGMAGVTLGLKNHYGTCNSPGSLHGGHCDPFIPALNALSPIKDKHIISIGDAITGIISGGPSGTPQVSPKSLIFSTDPVAGDTVARQMLKDHGTADSSINSATHIDTAAGSSYNLGIADPSQIEQILVENPSTNIKDPNIENKLPSQFQLFQNYPNPFNSETTLSYQLNKGSKVRVDIFDLHGKFVYRVVDQHQSPGYYRFNWDSRNSSGILVPSGIYFASFNIDGIRQNFKMQLIK